jgi:hypothetical protein
MNNIQASALHDIENHEMTLHRIRTQVLSFKVLAQKVIVKSEMSHEDFIYLLEAARVSPDYNDALTLNKLTVLFSNNNLN